MRAEATIRNSIWNIIYQAVYSLMNFAARIIMVRAIGLAFVGLNGLFSNVLGLLSLAELGIGTAIVFHLYKPLAENDQDKLCRLMHFYKITYRWIASFITVVGLALIPFLPIIVKGVDFDGGFITLAYCLLLVQTVTSYLWVYKASLIRADQKMYIVTRIELVFRIVSFLATSLYLWYARDYIGYLVVYLLCMILSNIYISRLADKLYPFIREEKHLGKSERRTIFQNVKDIFMSQLSWRVMTSTDNILISGFVSTIEVGLYSNYSMITNTITELIIRLSDSMQGSLGNLFARENASYIQFVLRRLSYIMFFITALCSVCLFNLLNPLIVLFFGAECLLGVNLVAVTVFNFFISSYGMPLMRMLKVSGLFRADKYIAITGAVVNLIISVVLGRLYGTFGILVGTSCSVVVQLILRIALFHRQFLHFSPTGYLLQSSLYTLLTTVECVGVNELAVLLHIGNPITSFAVRLFLCFAVSLFANGLLFCKTDGFTYALGTAKMMVARLRARKAS